MDVGLDLGDVHVLNPDKSLVDVFREVIHDKNLAQIQGVASAARS